MKRASLVLQTKDRSVACITQQKCLVQQFMCEMIQIGMGEYGNTSCWLVLLALVNLTTQLLSNLAWTHIP